MIQKLDTTDEYINITYQAFVLVIIEMALIMLLFKFKKFRLGDPTELRIEDIAKLVGITTVSVFTQEWLVKNGYLKPNIK